MEPIGPISYIFPDEIVDTESNPDSIPDYNPVFDTQVRIPIEIGEDLASILYSYNAVMADFQTNMNLYQRNIGLALGANQYTTPRRAAAIAVPAAGVPDMSAFIETVVYTSPADGIAPGVCPISLDQFETGDTIAKIRACGHEFKPAPLNDWFLRANTVCPICRNDVRGNRAPASASGLGLGSAPTGPAFSDHTRIAEHIIAALTRGFSRVH